MDQLEDAQSFVDPEEWRIDKSLLRLPGHLLTKKDGWLMMNQFKDAQSFVDQEEQVIDKSRLRLHGHLLIKKDGCLMDHG